MDEYNEKGWNSQDVLKNMNNSINDNISEDARSLDIPKQKMKDY